MTQGLSFICRRLGPRSALTAAGISLLFLASAWSLSGAGLAPFVASAPSTGHGDVPTGPADRASPLTLSAGPSFPTPIQHVVVVMDENQNYSTVLADGPFEAYLASTYATATNDYSIAHGSTHAYEAATSGSASNTYPLPYDNIGDLADAAGLSWDAFEQNMPTVCDTVTNWTAEYDTDHNPFIMYKDIVNNLARCDAHDLTFSSWLNDVNASSIPNYSFVTPNTINDDHNGTNQSEEIQHGDAWLKSWLSPLVNDSAIFSNTAFLITFDEDAGNNKNTPVVNNSSGGHIYMVIVSPYSKGLSSDAFYNSFSLLTTAEWLLGLPGGTLVNDSWTLNPPMEDLFYFPSYTVTFKETGLPSGTSWSVTVGDKTKSSTGSSITFSEEDGTRTYTANVAGSGNTTGSFTVSGGKLTVPLVFYEAALREEGLPGGGNWSVTLNNASQVSMAGALDFYLPNGTYPYAVADTPGWHQTTLPYDGNLSVNGEPVTEPTLEYVQVAYSAAFSESGLASGLTWQVTVNGVARNLTTTGLTDTLTWTDLPNGTYNYSVTDLSGWHQTTLPASGTLTVNGGTGPIDGTGVGYTVTLAYGTPVTYTVTISESTLPSGLNWSITLNDVMKSLVTDGGSESLSWTGLTNGTYPYTVAPVSGYTASPSSGNVTVNGSDASISISFAVSVPTMFSVTFTETGLPGGTNWSVTLTGTSSSIILDTPSTGAPVTLTRWSDGASSVQFTASNGSYSYSATAPGHYDVAGSLAINGPLTGSVPVAFVSSSPSSSGLSTLDYALIGVATVVVVVAIVAVLTRRKE